MHAVGLPKAEAARRRLVALNPNIKVVVHAEKLVPDNAAALVRDYDVVVDATDNFTARYLINEACVRAGKPNVSASILRFEGQLSVFVPGQGPCYRCLFPEPPPPHLAPSCAEAGVLGALPGTIGALQATEAIKLITGMGDPLVGRLVLYDALEMKFRELKLRKDPNCPICGKNPTVHELIDYDAFCGVLPHAVVESKDGVPEITVKELSERIKTGLDKTNTLLLDVREPNEWDIVHIDAARLMPKGEVPQHITEFAPYDEILVHCRSGARSADIVKFLRNDIGLKNVKNVKGGILAWAKEIDPSLPQY